MRHIRQAGIAHYCARLLCVGVLTLAQVFSGVSLSPVASAFAAQTEVAPGTGLQAAISAAAPGDTLVLSAGEYVTSGTVLVDKALTITGAGIDQTVVKTSSNTAGTSITTSLTTGWIRVAPSGSLNISALTLDGEHSAGKKVGAAVYASGPLHASGIRVTDVKYQSYIGIGLALIGAGHEVTGSTFDDIERLCLYIGAGSAANAPPLPSEIDYGTLVDGCTFVGSGVGDFCQYSMEIGRSGRAVVRNIDVTGFSGVTASGAWNSAGLLVDSYYGSGVASMTLEDSSFHDCRWGVEVGYPDQPRDTILNMSNTRFERVDIDLNISGATSIVSIPAGVDNDVVDQDWVYQWFDQTGATMTVPPALPNGFINWKPVVSSDAYTVAKNVAFSTGAPGFLGNDVDSDDDTLTILPVSDVETGTLTIEPTGGFSYSPPAGYTGVQLFTYRVRDWMDTSSVTTVTLNVVNTPPVAGHDTFTMRQGGLLLGTGSGVLHNDVDENGDSVTVRLLDDADHGSLVLHADGTFIYQPDESFVGTDAFRYVAHDGFAPSLPATVAISVANEVPEALSDYFEVPDSGILVVNFPGVLSNDIDHDDGPLTAAVLNPTEFGALVLAANGSFIYVPEAGFPGVDTFTYRAYDGLRHSEPVTVTITGEPIPYPSHIELSSVSTTLSAYNATYTVTGTLTANGSPLAGRKVVLQTTPSSFGTFSSTTVSATTDADGGFLLVHTPRSRTFYRVRFAGETGVYESVASSVVAALPRALITRPIAPKVARAGRPAAVRGYIRPRHANGSYPIRIYRYRYESGRWRSYGHVRAKATNYSGYSKYTQSIRLPLRGKWRLRAYHPADGGHAPSWSAYSRSITVK